MSIADPPLDLQLRVAIAIAHRGLAIDRVRVPAEVKTRI